MRGLRKLSNEMLDEMLDIIEKHADEIIREQERRRTTTRQPIPVVALSKARLPRRCRNGHSAFDIKCDACKQLLTCEPGICRCPVVKSNQGPCPVADPG